MAKIQLRAVPTQPTAYVPATDKVLVVRPGGDNTGTGTRYAWELFEPAIVVEASTAWDLAKASHFGRIVKAGNGSNILVTIPADLPGGSCTIIATDAGQVTIAAAGGVTLRYPSDGGLKSRTQWASLTLVRLAANEWWVSGGVA